MTFTDLAQYCANGKNIQCTILRSSVHIVTSKRESQGAVDPLGSDSEGKTERVVVTELGQSAQRSSFQEGGCKELTGPATHTTGMLR